MNAFPSPCDIKIYHAHLYYKDENGREIAKQVAQKASELFEIEIGRFHQKPVGPHPLWSCQLSFQAQQFDKVIPWLIFNRQNLDVFFHPVTGNEYIDHTQGVSWLGNSHELDITQFKAKLK